MKRESLRRAAVLSVMGIFFALLPLEARAARPVRQARAADHMHWTIALGAGMRPDYEGSDEYEPFPIGFLRLRWDSGRYATLKGTESSGAAVRVEGNVLASENFQLGPVLQYRLGRDHVGNGHVDDMDNIDGATELGGFLGYKFLDAWLVRATGVADVSGEHEGGLVELIGGYEKDYESGFGLMLHLASTWASDGYMETYFGVTPGDTIRSGLPTYDADAGFKDIGTRLALGYSGESWGPWRIYGIFSYYRLLGDAEDSPIVDEVGDPNQYFGGFALAYAR